MRAARALGVGAWACCGVSEADWDALAALASREPEIHPSFGLHPWHVLEAGPSWRERLAALLEAWPGAGVGEAGLDLARPGIASPETQEQALRAQIALARELGRPLSLHGVRAWGRLLEILREFGHHAPGLLCHGFSGASDLIPHFSTLNVFFSFPATLTRHRATRVHAAARAAPLDRLLVETDAPDIPPIVGDPASLPRGRDGRPINAPANLLVVLDALAITRGEDAARLGERTAENAARLFPARARP
jgi:TatD DNase family protein